jgi:hypothetical protein
VLFQAFDATLSTLSTTFDATVSTFSTTPFWLWGVERERDAVDRERDADDRRAAVARDLEFDRLAEPVDLEPAPEPAARVFFAPPDLRADADCFCCVAIHVS